MRLSQTKLSAAATTSTQKRVRQRTTWNPLDLTEYLIENRAATFMMRVDGDSMIEAGILDGDLLVVDRAAKPVNGSVVVVAVSEVGRAASLGQRRMVCHNPVRCQTFVVDHAGHRPNLLQARM